ncbi:MAG: hypothetical protein ACKVOX_13550 [Rhizobacter sp.]
MNDKDKNKIDNSINAAMEDISIISESEKSSSRRRLLLSGIAKGSAVASIAIPIKSLATERYVTSTGKLCTTSGTQSAAHSQVQAQIECIGGHPSFYCDTRNWPSPTNCKVNNKPFTPNSPCKDLCGGSATETLLNCLKNYPDSDNTVMITAILNCCKAKESSSIKSSYSPEEMKNLFATQRTAALAFCRGYMQTKRA